MIEKKVKRRTTNLQKRRGFLLAEVLFALGLFSMVLLISIQSLNGNPYQERARDFAFMNQFKGAIVNQRVRAVREPGVGFNFVMPGDGRVLFNRHTSTYLIMDDPDYRVYIQKGVWWKVLTLVNFKNSTSQGTNGFTIEIFKKGTLLGKLIFQVATSSFREEFYGK